ncbi:hypothetical protein ABZ816_34205 [Actinosynnema sp. NPDC047251]|uniref:hypothetical protein n=1 Tax=Saccharothrix espanaensis TaxID=103731 RepID=UPI00059E80A5|nr:hypothetical protein [Saccharothrix espanaensis]
MPAQEHPPGHRAEHQRDQARQHHTALGEVLDAVDERQHGHQRQGDARQVQPPGIGVAVLGQQDRPGDQQQAQR